MRNVFPRTVLLRAIQQINELVQTLGHGWFGTEWAERKQTMQRLLHECEDRGLQVVWLNNMREYYVDDFYSV